MYVWRESDESLFNHNLNMIFVTTYHLCQFGFNSTDVLRERADGRVCEKAHCGCHTKGKGFSVVFCTMAYDSLVIIWKRLLYLSPLDQLRYESVTNTM